MAKAKKPKPKVPTLEEQLAAMPPRPELDPVEPWMDGSGAEAQVAWDRQRRELLAAIRQRDNDAVRIVDPGMDASGHFGVSPFAARGHEIEIAPKKLGPELPKDGSYPKRRATQILIDRYKRRSQITLKQFRAAEHLLEVWQSSGLGPKLTASYDPVNVPGGASRDALIAKRVDAVQAWVTLMDVVPYRSRGVVRAVVIEDISAGAWAQGRGYRQDDSGRIGMERLRAGLQALVDYLGY